MEQSYKEKYEDILARLERAKNDNEVCDERFCCVIDDLIPELAESEDEKVRKELIRYFSEGREYLSLIPYNKEQCIAWLEKQGEQEEPQVYEIEDGEVITYSESEGYKVIKPKFKVGDWIISYYDNVAYIESISETKYNLRCKDGYHEKLDIDCINRNWRLWTIQDAKDGDVLCDYHDAYDNPLIFILKKFEHVNFGLAKPSDYSSYCFLTASDRQRFKEGTYHHKHNIKPATKEQRDLLFSKMKEAGYTFDFENKKLKKIEPKTKENKGNVGGISPNSEWSEEDDWMKKKIMLVLLGSETFLTPEETNELVYWLKSLKGRVQPKPKYNFGDTELTQEELCEGLIRGMVDEHNRVTKEVLRNEYEKGRADAIAEMQKDWSLVDKDILFRIICDLKFLRDTISIDPKYAVNIIDMEREITWLKSLRPQNRWKPSELQLGCLSDAIEHYNSLGYPATKLKELYEQLKKL